MHNRIREVRKALHMTQADFGAKIGVRGNTVTGYENGQRVPSDAVIVSICRTYDVNERWLRTGEGEMFIQISRDQEIMDFVADTMQDDEDNFRRRFLLALARLPSERWADIEAFAKQITAENKEADQD